MCGCPAPITGRQVRIGPADAGTGAESGNEVKATPMESALRTELRWLCRRIVSRAAVVLSLCQPPALWPLSVLHVGLGRGSYLSPCFTCSASPGLKVPCPRHVGLGRAYLSTCSGQPELKGAVSTTRGFGSWFSPLFVLHVLRSARA